jgi:hypothetical protein
MSDALTELDIAYPDSPLTVAGRHAPHDRKAGERWPPEELPRAAGGPEPAFTVVGEPKMVAQLAERFPALVRAAPGGPADGLWIVRPDGYIGLAAGRDDVASAEGYLAGIASA